MNFFKKLQMMFKRTGTDKTIYACTIFLACFGIVMIGDASVGMSASRGSNFATINLLKQCVFVAGGFFCMFLFARVYKTRRISETIMLSAYVICILMMLACLMWTINNSHAWIKVGPITIQPVEFMKLVMIIILSYIFGVLPDQVRISNRLSAEKRKKLVRRKFILCVAFPALLVFFAFFICWKVQKDMGSGLILLVMSACLFFATPSQYYRPYKIIGLFLVFLAVLVFILFHERFLKGHQMARIASWLNPLKDIYGSNYQIINGFVGYTNGGLIGRGFGNSIMKFGYIPEAQNDFISSIIVEELGLVGFAAFFIPYSIIICRLFRYAFCMKESRDKLTLIGIASYFFVHLMVNVGGVSGLIPMTGVPLLLISAGGTSTLMALTCIGVAQALIAKYNREKKQEAIEKSL
ncbi:MAG: FtsW/RodA/SpoVE family cell cycle protein [Catenibacterium mitsuokai]|uniref:FtsW/RodA/SpoVE family cell cycle protein n=1 Tax=Catenibacterium TaxID=135858 RepID=UPI002432F821|nr:MULTISPECIES: FtsW/RodA/SpoVE family cell cycle protein [Catenibacterium]MCI6077055.1 FtsW/RodA/SpoVE family cell cycle protein [Catenibacterium mitsuokai]MDD6595327.1 FtsW/RodA/SpoVE family cell cycle protein [Catenibacterium mitsuokai]MDY3676106.1 FtsW/RodA/SpoVE family cell cycle protein [Catenibacterium mitsuokai]